MFERYEGSIPNKMGSRNIEPSTNRCFPAIVGQIKIRGRMS
ncbi:MAG: hypothetical protein JWM91_3916 [Rhodospirillales bacterium]|nr:hypothetical protein [Rhodospirillales bacterium]